ncbi:carboxymuconolactone decarboxylase family protein [Roseomonas sp. GCM10028921]
MARLPYADPNRAEVAPITARIVQERGSVLHLYAMLLHSAPVAEGWLRFLTAIRHECALPGSVRELVIMQVAHLNHAPYEAEQHAPIALREGLTPAQVGALPNWQHSDEFGERERAVLAYCDMMTRTVHVDGAVFEAVRRHFDERMMVELTATIAAYNMVSRFIEAVGISSSDNMDPVR